MMGFLIFLPSHPECDRTNFAQLDFDFADTLVLILGLLSIEPEKREPIRLDSHHQGIYELYSSRT